MVKDNPLEIENIEDEELAAQDHADGHCGVACCSSTYLALDCDHTMTHPLRGSQDEGSF